MCSQLSSATRPYNTVSRGRKPFVVATGPRRPVFFRRRRAFHPVVRETPSSSRILVPLACNTADAHRPHTIVHQTVCARCCSAPSVSDGSTSGFFFFFFVSRKPSRATPTAPSRHLPRGRPNETCIFGPNENITDYHRAYDDNIVLLIIIGIDAKYRVRTVKPRSTVLLL